MKSSTYKTRVAFSGSEFISCTCNCQSGLQQHNNHAHIHTIAKMDHLTLLLFDRLVQNILIELHVRLSDERLTNEDDKSLKKLIVHLMPAAGVCAQDNGPFSSLDMLSIFAMLTDKYKPPPGAPRQEDLYLIHDMKFNSPESIASQIIKGETGRNKKDQQCFVHSRYCKSTNEPKQQLSLCHV